MKKISRHRGPWNMFAVREGGSRRERKWISRIRSKAARVNPRGRHTYWMDRGYLAIYCLEHGY